MHHVSNLTLNNKTYDRLKHLTQVGLPATGALYFGLAQIWGLPASEEVSGTILCVTTFLGTILGISSKNYEEPTAGDIVVEEREDGSKVASMDLHEQDAATLLRNNDRLVFKVKDLGPLA